MTIRMLFSGPPAIEAAAMAIDEVAKPVSEQ
jgi:hypothetical protein